jgi:hypothetical protein
MEKSINIQIRRDKDPIPWLLNPVQPAGVRYLTLRDLLDLPENDPKVQAERTAAHREEPIAGILANLDEAGFWVKPGPGYNPKYKSSVWSILFLAQLGAKIDADERISLACDYLLEHALTSRGQFTMTGAPSGTIDCLQGNLCWALTELGCRDPRLDLAYEWMARSITGEGIASGEDKEADVRYYAYNCGPLFACGGNDQVACAWGAVKAMLAFSRLPMERRTPQVKAAIDLGIQYLLSVDPLMSNYPAGPNSKPSKNWWKLGFPVFYITDLLQTLEALAGLGLGNDPRLAKAIQWVLEKQNPQGQWVLEYDYAGKTWASIGSIKQANPWVTIRALRMLKAVQNLPGTYLKGD